jgi:hypothetical protein
MTRALLLLVALVAWAGPAWAACTGPSGTTWTTTPDLSSVQDCINNAASGHTIQITAGTATWTAGISFNNKSITLQGAGVGNTVITLDGNVTNIVSMGTGAARLTGIEFRLISGDHTVNVRGQGFRIDHNKFHRPGTVSTANRVHVFSSGGTGIPHPTGLIDNNDFLDGRFYIQADLRLIANEIWGQASTIGKPDQTGVIYIENNNFINSIWRGNQVDYQYGARVVVRWNQFQNGLVEVHSSQEGHDRGSRSFEHYNNTFTGIDTGTLSGFNCHFIRGGTGMIFNETCTGTYGDFSWLDNYRSYDPGIQTSRNGGCDGTNTSGTFDHPWDGNVAGQAGWWCRDQIGRGQDSVPIASCSGPTTNCMPTTPQASEPLYAWNNRNKGALVNLRVVHCGNDVKVNGSCADIQPDRDYYSGNVGPNSSPGVQWNGTTGVGWGPRDNRPATCTAGVAYWSTDKGGNWDTTHGGANDGTLDKCLSTNNWVDGVYTPAIYPYNSTAIVTPSAPTGFQIVP